jgi:hypothetical protein
MGEDITPNSAKVYNVVSYMNDDTDEYTHAQASEDIRRASEAVYKATKGVLTKICLTIVVCKVMGVTGKIILGRMASKK